MKLKGRREFLRTGSTAVATLGLTPHLAVGKTATPDYYDKLGVTKIINAAGTYTALTASTMPPSVQAAVARAAKHPVRLARTAEEGGRVSREETELRSGHGDGRRRVGADAGHSRVRHDRQPVRHPRYSHEVPQ